MFFLQTQFTLFAFLLFLVAGLLKINFQVFFIYEENYFFFVYHTCCTYPQFLTCLVTFVMVLVTHFALQKFAPTFSTILNVLIYLGAVRALWGNIRGNARHPVAAYPPWVCLSARPCFPQDSALQEHLASCSTSGIQLPYTGFWRDML